MSPRRESLHLLINATGMLTGIGRALLVGRTYIRTTRSTPGIRRTAGFLENHIHGNVGAARLTSQDKTLVTTTKQVYVDIMECLVDRLEKELVTILATLVAQQARARRNS